MKNITTIFNKSMKMSDLIDADYRLLLLLMRLEIPLGFGDKSVEAVCSQSGFDPDCFIFLVNFQLNKSILDVEKEFNLLPLEPFLVYLKKSHSYFLEDRLPNIRRKLKMIYGEEEKEMRDIVLLFFDNYVREVYDHMNYEDDVVFPYVWSLFGNNIVEDYSIQVFEDRHNNIDETVSELKRILMKYVSAIKDQKLMTNILLELYMAQEELESHTYIEDYLVIPRVRLMEKKIRKK